MVERIDKEETSGGLKNLVHSISDPSQKINKTSSLLPSSLVQINRQNLSSNSNILSQEKINSDKNHSVSEKKIISSKVLLLSLFISCRFHCLHPHLILNWGVKFFIIHMRKFMRKVMIVYTVILHVNVRKHEHHIQHQKDLQHHFQYLQIFLVQSRLLAQPILTQVIHILHHLGLHTLLPKNPTLQFWMTMIIVPFYHNLFLNQPPEKLIMMM
jgi:hypothetical protein